MCSLRSVTSVAHGGGGVIHWLCRFPVLVAGPPFSVQRVEPVHAVALLHHFGDERFLAFLRNGIVRELVGEGRRNHQDAVQSATMMSPGCTVIPPQAMVMSVSHGMCRRPRTAGCRVGVVGGHVHCRHGGEVADTAVGDDGGGAADLGAEGQDVADGAGALFAARLHHQDLALVDGIDGLLLGVEAAAVGLGTVLAVGHGAGSGQAHDPLVRAGGGEAVDADVVQARACAGDRVAVQTLPASPSAPGSGRTTAAGSRRPRPARRPRGTRRPPPLQVIRSGPGTKVGERRRAFLYPVTRRPVVRLRQGADLNLEDVARLGDRRAGGGAGQDDVALLEGEQLGQRSATSRANGKSRSSVVSSWTSSPLCQVRIRRLAGSTASAAVPGLRG